MAPRNKADELFDALKSRNLNGVRLLVNANPALVEQRNETGESPLLVALYYGAREIAEFLRPHMDRLDLFEAAAFGEVDRVRDLLNGDPAALNSHSHDGWTPLHLAAFFGNKAVAELLIARGAELSPCSTNGNRNTPLHAALAGRHDEVARLLVMHGAEPNAVDAAGYTPLHHAAHAGSNALTRLLLERGSDPSTTTTSGETARQLAEAGGHTDVAQLLGYGPS